MTIVPLYKYLPFFNKQGIEAYRRICLALLYHLFSRLHRGFWERAFGWLPSWKPTSEAKLEAAEKELLKGAVQGSI